jgi:hypothetical protein
MQACSLLLGHPWEFDTDVVHHGRANKYTLVHKGKKITLLPLTPNEIMQCHRAIADMAKHESKIQHDQIAPPSSSNAIKLKSRTILATRSDLFIPTTVDAPYHALVCRQVYFHLMILLCPCLALSLTFCRNLKTFSCRDTPGVTTFERNSA